MSSFPFARADESGDTVTVVQLRCSGTIELARSRDSGREFLGLTPKDDQ